jgi:hypothetical protein
MQAAQFLPDYSANRGSASDFLDLDFRRRLLFSFKAQVHSFQIEESATPGLCSETIFLSVCRTGQR